MTRLSQVLLLIVCTPFICCVHMLAQDADKLQAEASLRSPIRYVIVYNDVFENERRIEILFNAADCNEASLRKIFTLIKDRFPEPLDLEIEAHVNLATIETPEERDMLKDSVDSRFIEVYNRYKRASYSRFSKGREAFTYTLTLSPFKEKTVVMVNKPAF